MSKSVLTKKISTIFLVVILIVGVIEISSQFTALGESYQSIKCDDTNVNINGINQEQIQRQSENNNFDATATEAQQLTPEEETLKALTSNGEPLVNLERNIVNICFNTNDNFLDAEFIGTQEQLPPTPPPPPPPPPVDTEPPNVLSFTAEPFRVIFSSGGTITITAHVTDATGVQRVGVFIQDECGGSPGFFRSFELPLVSGTSKDGIYQSTFTFPESALGVNHFCNPNLAFQIGGVVTDTLGNGKGLPLIGVILEP